MGKGFSTISGACAANRKAAAFETYDMRGKTVVVTGANTGLGYKCSRELAKMGAKVVMCSRSAEKGNAAMEQLRAEAGADPVEEGVALVEGVTTVSVEVEELDLGSLASVKQFASRMHAKGLRIDVLMNNAGVSCTDYKETVDGFEQNMGVNVLGHQYLTHLLLPLIDKQQGRIIFITSGGHDHVMSNKTQMRWEDPNFQKEGSFTHYDAYGQSKLGNVWQAMGFGDMLKETGVTTYAPEPGVADTELVRDMKNDGTWVHRIVLWGPIYRMLFSPAIQAAQTQIYCAASPEAAKAGSGHYWGQCKVQEPSELSKTEGAAARAMALFDQLIEAKLGHSIASDVQEP